MPLTEFTYEVTHNSITEQYYPIVNDLVFNEEEGETKVFKRRTLESVLIFEDNPGASVTDFSKLRTIRRGPNSCEPVVITIKYKGTLYWEGLLNLYSGDWDESKCRLEITPESEDNYRCLIDMWEDEYNIFTIGKPVDSSAFQGEVEVVTCQQNFNPPQNYVALGVLAPYPIDLMGGCITELDGWTLIYSQGLVPENFLNTIRRTYIREFINTTCVDGNPVPPAGDGWTLVENNCSTTGTAKYVRRVNRNYNAATSTYYTNNTTDWEIFWDPAGVFIDENGDYQTAIYPNGRTVEDLMSYFGAFCSLEIQSDILGINPPGDSPVNIAYTSADPNLKNLVVHQITDIKTPNADQQATRGRLNFKELLELLRDSLDIWFYVPSSGVLRLEHISFFDQPNGLDLMADPDAVFRMKGLNKYTYTDTEIPRRERFIFGQRMADVDFDGRDIVYPAACSTGDIKERVVKRFFTNVEEVNTSPDLYPNDAFVLLAASRDDAGNYFVVSETGIFSNTIRQNGHLALSNILPKYWQHRRPRLEGNMNGVDVTFQTAELTKKQVPLNVKMSREDFLTLDTSRKVQSEIGWGEIESLSYSTKTCMIEFNLRHPDN